MKKRIFQKIISVSIIVTLLFPLMPLQAMASSSPKIDFINQNKASFINQANDVVDYTYKVTEITDILIGSDAWFSNLGVLTGSATSGFTTAIKTMSTDSGNILNAATLLGANYTAQKARDHANTLKRLANGTITVSTGQQLLEEWKQMIYYRTLTSTLCQMYIDDYASVANASKAVKYQHLSQKFLDGAFNGALSGFGTDWGRLVEIMKTAIEHGTSTGDAILAILKYHNASKVAQDMENDCQKNIDKYNSLPDSFDSTQNTSPSCIPSSNSSINTVSQKQETAISNDNYEYFVTLKSGMYHRAVPRLRTWLNLTTGSNLNTTSWKFDNAVLQAVKKFQKTRGLTVDGIVGWNTHYKLLNCYQAMQKVPMNCYVTIRNAQGNKVLDCSADMWGMNHGITILYDKFTNPINTCHYNQVFLITYSSDGALILKSPFQHKVLEISDGNTNLSFPITVYDDATADKNWTTWMRWFVEPDAYGNIRFVNVCTGTAIDLQDNCYQNNTLFTSYSINNTLAQSFIVERV